MRSALLVFSIALLFASCSAASNEVAMTNNARFDPAATSVEAGSTVTFVNDSNQPHTVTAYEDEAPDGEFFSSGGFDSETAARDGLAAALIPPGETFEVTLEAPGTYRYFCIPHEQQGMRGTLEVG
jgi:plastocyanin